MAQRSSGYDLADNNTYVTPIWVFQKLFQAETFPGHWDCAPVNANFDFLDYEGPCEIPIVTNPPYGRNGQLAIAFVRHALKVTKEHKTKVAMLLSNGFDTGKRRVDVFRDGPFKAKYVLLDRIRWANLEQKAAGPSQNHAWYVWDWEYTGKPKLDWI